LLFGFRCRHGCDPDLGGPVFQHAPDAGEQIGFTQRGLIAFLTVDGELDVVGGVLGICFHILLYGGTPLLFHRSQIISVQRFEIFYPVFFPTLFADDNPYLIIAVEGVVAKQPFQPLFDVLYHG